MKCGRLVIVSEWMAGLVIVGVLAAHLATALRAQGVEQRRLAALEAQHEARQQSQEEGLISVMALNLVQPVTLDMARPALPADEPPSHTFIVPVPPEVDEWTLEWRVPVAAEERSRWIPFKFDGITYHFAQLSM